MTAVSDESDLRRRAERRVAAKAGFQNHTLVYLLVNAGLVAMNLLTSPQYFWAGWPMFGWGIGLVAHGLSLRGPNSRQREDAIRREMERMR